LARGINLQIQEADWTPSRINSRNPCPDTSQANLRKWSA
jgi:hypothetical protein